MYTQWDVLKGFSHLLATTGIFLCPQSSLNADWYIGCPQRDLQSEYSKGRNESRDGRLYTMKIYNGSKGRSEAEMDGEQNGIREKKGSRA